jgi:hypothetical protein
MKNRNILISVLGAIAILTLIIWCATQFYKLKMENENYRRQESQVLIINNNSATSSQNQIETSTSSTQINSTNISPIKWNSTTTNLGGNNISINFPSIGETKMEPQITIINKSDLDAKGCNSSGYTTDPNINMQSDKIININGIKFCQSYFSDAAMSHLYYEYNNVFSIGNTYYNIRFLLSVINGCDGVYDDAASVAQCNTRTENTKTLLDLISQTLATLNIR